MGSGSGVDCSVGSGFDSGLALGLIPQPPLQRLPALVFLAPLLSASSRRLPAFVFLVPLLSVLAPVYQLCPTLMQALARALALPWIPAALAPPWAPASWAPVPLSVSCICMKCAKHLSPN